MRHRRGPTTLTMACPFGGEDICPNLLEVSVVTDECGRHHPGRVAYVEEAAGCPQHTDNGLSAWQEEVLFHRVQERVEEGFWVWVDHEIDRRREREGERDGDYVYR